MKNGIEEGTGTENNRVNIGSVTELLGDPNIKQEKPYTIIKFPGGDVEISRCEDGRYWVHVAVRDEREFGGFNQARIVDARMDFAGRYDDAGNAALKAAVEAGDVNHIAFLIDPRP